MIQIRPHVSDYIQSMSRAVYINDADDLFAYVRCHYPEKRARDAEFTQRHFGPDHRNGWDSWLIMLRKSPLLWADAPVPGLTQLESLASIAS